MSKRYIKPVTARPVKEPAQSSASTSTARVYFCICGEFLLVCDRPIGMLPRRPADGSLVLSNVEPKHLYRLNGKAEERPVLVRREGGLERQCRVRCPRCQLQVAYETVVPETHRKIKPEMRVLHGPYTYILAGAVTERQGQVPPDAFDLDPGRLLADDQRDAQPSRTLTSS